MTRAQLRQRGSALWFILVGVALLAALTMILSRSGSTVDQSGDFEQRSIKINQMLRYAKSIESAIQEMRLRGVSENEISFENTVTTTDYTNTNCDDASDRNFPDCRVFGSGGAGLNYQAPPEGINDGSEWVFNGRNVVDGSGTTNVDLVMILPNVRDNVCSQINRQLDSEHIYGNDPDVDFAAFTGAFAGAATINLADGAQAGCSAFTGNGPVEPFFFYVLIAR